VLVFVDVECEVEPCLRDVMPEFGRFCRLEIVGEEFRLPVVQLVPEG